MPGVSGSFVFWATLVDLVLRRPGSVALFECRSWSDYRYSETGRRESLLPSQNSRSCFTETLGKYLLQLKLRHGIERVDGCMYVSVSVNRVLVCNAPFHEIHEAF